MWYAPAGPNGSVWHRQACAGGSCGHCGGLGPCNSCCNAPVALKGGPQQGSTLPCLLDLVAGMLPSSATSCPMCGEDSNHPPKQGQTQFSISIRKARLSTRYQYRSAASKSPTFTNVWQDHCFNARGGRCCELSILSNRFKLGTFH